MTIDPHRPRLPGGGGVRPAPAGRPAQAPLPTPSVSDVTVAALGPAAAPSREAQPPAAAGLRRPTDRAPRRASAAAGESGPGLPLGASELRFAAALEAVPPPNGAAAPADWNPSDIVATVLEELRLRPDAWGRLSAEHQLRILALGIATSVPVLGEAPPAGDAAQRSVAAGVSLVSDALIRLDGVSAMLVERGAVQHDGPGPEGDSWWTPVATQVAEAAVTARAQVWLDALPVLVGAHRARRADATAPADAALSPVDAFKARVTAYRDSSDAIAHDLHDVMQAQMCLRDRLAAVEHQEVPDAAHAAALRRMTGGLKALNENLQIMLQSSVQALKGALEQAAESARRPGPGR